MCPKLWTHYGHILDTSFHTGGKTQMCQKFGLIMDTFFVLDMFWTHYGHLLDTFGV